MSVILRLQGLPHRTNSHDIQEFFVGLDIPKEGITFIGGREAIVDLASWDNAYQALQMSGHEIRNSTIQISVITAEEKQQALEKLKSSEDSRNGTSERKSRKSQDHCHEKYFYLRLDIGDLEATPEDVKHFFDGLHVSGVTFFQEKDSPKNAIAVTKFDSSADATEGFNRYKESKLLSVVWSSEKEWVKYGGSVENDDEKRVSSTSGHSRNKTRSRSRGRRSKSPRKRSRSPRRRSRSPRRSRSQRKCSRSRGRHSRSRGRRSRSPRRRSRSPRRRSRSPRRRSRSSRRRSRSPKSSSRTTLSSKSPASQSDEQDSSNADLYYLQIMNLSYRSSKADLMKLLKVPSDSQIFFMYDERGHRTRNAFATFTNKEDYQKAKKLNNVTFKGHELFVSPITKSVMEKYVANNNCPQAYLYLKNFSPEVSKNDVHAFLDGFNLLHDNISLLFDKSNKSRGEAMVKLSSLEETVRAEKLNRKTFKNRQISLKRIYEKDLESFLKSNELFMLTVDPTECVTQEDDLSDEEEATLGAHNVPVTQDVDMDTSKEQPVTQEVGIQECIAQADD
ncbi:RNA-binding protein 12B-like [Gastrophryne carolinensis]